MILRTKIIEYNTTFLHQRYFVEPPKDWNRLNNVFIHYISLILLVNSENQQENHLDYVLRIDTINTLLFHHLTIKLFLHAFKSIEFSALKFYITFMSPNTSYNTTARITSNGPGLNNTMELIGKWCDGFKSRRNNRYLPRLHEEQYVQFRVDNKILNVTCFADYGNRFK